MNCSSRRYTLDDLLRVMTRLRDPESGCPWDKTQTFNTIVPSTLEECYELASAIEQQDFPHVAEELGDVLFQVIFYAELGREQDLFDFEAIVHALVDKLLRRHPHVFHEGDIEGVVSRSSSIEQVAQSWETIKQSERVAKSQSSVLADLPLALPALPRAQKLQKRAATVGFDWTSSGAVFTKLQEEVLELQAAIAENSAQSIEDEMGDLLFTCVNLARHLGLDAEASLRRSSQKFELRFGAMEGLVSRSGGALEELGPAALDTLWEKVKADLSAAS